jgi:hypothetical protein
MERVSDHGVLGIIALAHAQQDITVEETGVTLPHQS